MTALPPAGWYADPESGGTRWRWWDGFRWAPPGFGYQPVYDPAAFALALQVHAETTRNTGKWFRGAMTAYSASMFLLMIAAAVAFHGGFHLTSTASDGTLHFSRAWIALELLSLPLNLVAMAYFALFVAWLYNAGKFADLQRWPSIRGRTLGAFSVLIPIVNFWWPYEALRDLYPPGARPEVALQWWISYLLVPLVAYVSVFIAALTGPLVLTSIVVMLAGGLLTIPVVLGWRLVDDLDAMQRAHSAPAT